MGGMNYVAVREEPADYGDPASGSDIPDSGI
jgi:hypothetical protein